MNTNAEFVLAAEFQSKPSSGVGVRKSFASTIEVVEKANAKKASGNTVRFKLSTGSVDREGDSINAAGWVLENYRKAPVVLFAHDNKRPPVARAARVWTDSEALWADAEFMSTDIDTSGFSDMLYRMIEAGFLHGSSVGMVPIEWKRSSEPKRRGGIDFLKQELVEFSIVPIPSHPETLAQVKSLGIDTAPLVGWLESTLDNWNACKNGVLMPRRRVEKAYKALSGLGGVFHMGEAERATLLEKNLKAVKEQSMYEDISTRLLAGEEVCLLRSECGVEFLDTLHSRAEADNRRLVATVNLAKHPHGDTINASPSDELVLSYEPIVEEVEKVEHDEPDEVVENTAPDTFVNAIPYDVAHPEGAEVSQSIDWDRTAELDMAGSYHMNMSAWWAPNNPQFVHHQADGRLNRLGLFYSLAEFFGAIDGFVAPYADFSVCYQHLKAHLDEVAEVMGLEAPDLSAVTNEDFFLTFSEFISYNDVTGEITLVEKEDSAKEMFVLVETAKEEPEPEPESEKEVAAKDVVEAKEQAEDNGMIWSARMAAKRPMLTKGIKPFLPNIASRIYNQPLLIHGPKLVAILSVLGDRIGLSAEALIQAANELGAPTEKELEGQKLYNISADGIATIPVRGTLVHDSDWLDNYSGMTSYSTLQTKFEEAMADDDVKAIALLMDSPGGESSGLFDFADTIYEARGEKPIWSIINEHAYSAAYAIASAADVIAMPRTGGVGSIGVYSMHVDMSNRLGQQGVSIEYIHAGEKKVDGNPYEKLSNRARADIQAEVDDIYGIFVNTVARNRGISSDVVIGTQADTFSGKKAVDIGLADGIGSVRSAYAALSKELTRSGSKSNAKHFAYTITKNLPDGVVKEYRAKSVDEVMRLASSDEGGVVEKPIEEKPVTQTKDLEAEIRKMLQPGLEDVITEMVKKELNRARGRLD